jgi:uncharacterized protein YigA (DUF484 family)
MFLEEPSAADVAGYLREHPDFLAEHPDVFAAIAIPTAYGGQATSLHERQMEVLREKNRLLELRLADMLRIAQDNDTIGGRLGCLTRLLLLSQTPGELPNIVCDAMSTIFSVPQVALRLWRLREPFRSLPQAEAVPADAVTLAEGMKLPYCGPNVDCLAAAWLPGAGADTRSLALLPLRRGAESVVFGLLVLGSADVERFRVAMGTAYLERIAEAVSAALSRLIE